MIKSKDPHSFLKYFKKFKKIYFIDMKQNNAYSKAQDGVQSDEKAPA